MKTFIIISVLLLAIMPSCNHKINENQSEQPIHDLVKLNEQQLKNLTLSYTKLDTMPFSRTIKLTGVIDVPPQNMVSISVPMGGYLKYTKLLPGMHIRKGETLATVEDQQFIQLQQDYLLSQSKLRLAELEFQRQKELNANKASSDKVFQTAEADYQQLNILLKSYAEKLKMIGINPLQLNYQNISSIVQIRSPIDGYVTKVNVNIGKYIMPSEIMFELVDPKDIHLNLTVFENEINNLYMGQKLKAYTNTNPQLSHPCHIILIGKDFSSQKSVSVHCHFDDYDQALLPGMFMNAELQTKSISTMVLPSESVLAFEGKHYVFVKQDSDFKMLEIQVGASHQNFTEILNHELLADKIMVEKGAYTLLMTLKNNEE
jgi:membrane fusion protein, heavy metal efflux system